MRRRFTYANVAATMALVFSMSGGALAAKHYLISSTQQISPKVLKKLKGATGKTGAKGTTGTAGATGAQGTPGSAGKEGPVGPYPTVLGSGQTESGEWGGSINAAAAGAGYRGIGSFPIPLAADIAIGKVVYVSGASATHCSGIGHAERGFLCVYQGFVDNVGTPTTGNVFNGESASGEDEESGLRGFAIFLSSTAAGTSSISGSFAVTAP